MGGSASGRMATWPSIERTRSLVLDINELRRIGIVRRGEDRTGTLQWQGERQAVIHLRSFVGGEHGSVSVHGEADNICGEPFELGAQVISVTSTPGGFGGRRFWFICPLTRRRVGRLYLPFGVRRFASRRAYGLVYDSTRETRTARLERRARQLRVKLGGCAENFSDYPRKPHRMRWRTYEAALDRIAVCEGAAFALDDERLTRIFARHSREGAP